MKKVTILFLLLASLALALPPDSFAWCWIRNTGTTNVNCGGGSTVQQTCCTGDLRIYTAHTMAYRISTSTSSNLYTNIRAGFQKWNDVAMADFVFTEGSTTTEWDAKSDGVNLMNIDASFCTHHPTYCGVGILGFSGTWTSTSGGYHATESDIVLNGSDYTWQGDGGTQDTVGVVAHEAGHNAGVTHPGSTCRSSGSSGCGPEFEKATMYWNYSYGQPTTKSSLELDDVASLVYGYPVSTFRVQVVDGVGSPISGATVNLLGTAVPVNGTSITTGGTVLGDVTNTDVLFGDKATSTTYVDSTPFTVTDGSGYTNYVNPVHRTFQVQVVSGAKTVTVSHTVADNTSTLIVTLPDKVKGNPGMPLLLLDD